MRVVASMLVRNEADFIEEVVNAVFQYVDHLVVLDGASDDGTLEILERLVHEADKRHQQFMLRSRPDPEDRFRDVYRQELLDTARQLEPVWHWTIDGDEYPDEDPIPYIERAEATGANLIECRVPNFWLTIADIRKGCILEEFEDPQRSVLARRRWYSWGWRGDFIFREYDSLYYPDTRKRTADGFPHRQRLNPGPVIRHYPFRSLSQSVSRMRERLERGGTWFFGKYGESWIMDEEFCKLHYLTKWIPPGVWATERNHELLYKYWKHVREGRA